MTHCPKRHWPSREVSTCDNLQAALLGYRLQVSHAVINEAGWWTSAEDMVSNANCLFNPGADLSVVSVKSVCPD